MKVEYGFLVVEVCLRTDLGGVCGHDVGLGEGSLRGDGEVSERFVL